MVRRDEDDEDEVEAFVVCRDVRKDEEEDAESRPNLIQDGR